MSSAFDRPGKAPDTPPEADGGVGKASVRSDTWLNLDNESDEKLLSFLGLERADKPHEVTPPQADAGYYPTIPRTTPERLNSVPVFDGPPRREQIAQGAVGDCGVLSTLGGVAGHRPDTIKNLIKQTGDGKYEITLHDVTPATSTDPVSRPTGDTTTYRVNDELPVATGDRKPIGVRPDTCTWPALLEKVVAAEDQTWNAKQAADWGTIWKTVKPQVDAERRSSGLPPASADAPTGYNRIDIGSTAYQRADLLTRLTGEEAEVRSFPNHQQGDQALLKELGDQLAADKPVLVGSRGERTPGELIPFIDFAFRHAYEVTKVEAGKIHLSNPWGDQHTPPPIDATTFWEYFREYNAHGPRDGQYTTLK